MKTKHSKSIIFFAYKNIEPLTFSVSIAGVAKFLFKVLLIFKIGLFSKSKRFFDIVKKKTKKKNQKIPKKQKGDPPSPQPKKKRKIRNQTKIKNKKSNKQKNKM